MESSSVEFLQTLPLGTLSLLSTASLDVSARVLLVAVTAILRCKSPKQSAENGEAGVRVLGLLSSTAEEHALVNSICLPRQALDIPEFSFLHCK